MLTQKPFEARFALKRCKIGNVIGGKLPGIKAYDVLNNSKLVHTDINGGLKLYSANDPLRQISLTSLCLANYRPYVLAEAAHENDVTHCSPEW